VPFRDQRLATAYRIALRACGCGAPPRRGCIAWPFERTAGASVTHCFRAARPQVVRRPRRSAPRSSMPATPARISRHCSRRAGLRPARQSAPLTWTFGNSCEDADARRARCTMKPWLYVSEAAEYAGLSRDTIYTACEQEELRSARVSGRRTIRIRPAWIDAWLERHAPDVQDRPRIGDAQNGAAS
jgi:excisionase family DNA binding protein